MLKLSILFAIFVIFTNLNNARADFCSKEMTPKQLNRVVKEVGLSFSKSQQDSLFELFEKTQSQRVAVVSDPQLALLLESITGRFWKTLDQTQMQNILFLAFKKIPLKIAQIKAAHTSRANHDDLRQEANLALLKAMRNYPVGSTTSFTTYAVNYVDWSLTNFEREQEIGSLSWVQENAQ